MPIPKIVQASRKTIENLQLFGCPIWHVRIACSPISPARPTGLLHDDPIAIETSKELAPSFALIPAQLPMAAEMIDNEIGEDEGLLGGADPIFDHAASARRHSPQLADVGHSRS